MGEIVKIRIGFTGEFKNMKLNDILITNLETAIHIVRVLNISNCFLKFGNEEWDNL